ncbi:fumitremorgin C monooxygenase [Penicillium sp. CMV-2018d]|nr:fumitremorgin C monooxygenase [Penicillium sp. CMV-2018d]
MARNWIKLIEPFPFYVIPVASILILGIAALFWITNPYAGQSEIPISANAFKLISDIGPVLVLSPKYAKELRNDDRLNIVKFTIKVNPGSSPFIEPLAHEASNALADNWGDSREWQAHTLKPCILKIVAQLSSRIFAGDSLCRNPQWQDITITYTINLYIAAHALALWPRFLRPLVNWFLPSCRILRKQIKDARSMINPIIMKRRAASEQGQMLMSASDAVGWLEENYRGQNYDPASAQIFLSFAAIHSTSDLLTQVLFDICGQKDLIDDLRKEIVSTIQETGWTKASLHNLKLMDSVLKETQRLKPVRLFSMGRVAEATIDLSDGLRIPKGTSVMVSNHGMWDPDIYPDHETFDGYRFLRLRQHPGQERYCQLISSTPNHMGFGYGKHACPGRFLAATEMKVALCIMLLKYEFKYEGKSTSEKLSYGFNLLPSPQGKIWVRRRDADIELKL